MLPDDFRYVDFDKRVISQEIATFFPGWVPGDERVMIFCPHDDDGPLGAGYAILAVQANGGEVFVGIFCDGWAGYSKPEDASTIVARRAAETINAYADFRPLALDGLAPARWSEGDDSTDHPHPAQVAHHPSVGAQWVSGAHRPRSNLSHRRV